LACSTTTRPRLCQPRSTSRPAWSYPPCRRLAELRPPPRPNPDRRRARPYEPARAPILIFATRASSSQDSSTPCSTCASCACGQVAPDPRASASRCPTLGQTGQKLLVTGAGIAPHRSSASPRSLPKLWHRWPRAAHDQPAPRQHLQHQANTAACVSRSISRGCAKSSSGPAWPRQRNAHKAPQRQRIRQAPGDARSAPMPSKYPINKERSKCPASAKDVQTAAHRT